MASGLMTPVRPPLPLFERPRVDGVTFNEKYDQKRLGGQLGRVYEAMLDNNWHSLDELVARCGGTHASISARLRDLRKARFGGHCVERRRVGDPARGIFQYKLLPQAHTASSCGVAGLPVQSGGLGPPPGPSGDKKVEAGHEPNGGHVGIRAAARPNGKGGASDASTDGG